MPNITLADAQDATTQADNRFADRDDALFYIDLSVQNNVPVIFGMRGNQYNYGLPTMYTLPYHDINVLEEWWQQRHVHSGNVLPLQYKHGAWMINLQWTSTRKELFNMHIAVSGFPVISGKDLSNMALAAHRPLSLRSR